ncbi:glycoside hydrolase family 32 protein, partial [Anaerovibrio sp.]|uniref:glycoside hydrolase family 32 protein n=1 Tax=Anaerovibrio sp. TaxID=1872532 RepID=UPI003F165DF4
MRYINKNQVEEKLQTSYPLSGRWHNGFHLEMPFGLINDPNGLAFANGEYHIFFQWNPVGCEHKHKCWAYTKTKDFAVYSRPRLAMQPTDSHDKDGCYSGCGFAEKGGVRVLYTCNAKDECGVRTPAQRLGTLQADGTIRKDEIIVEKEAEGYTAHFRDPYIFQRNGRRYFVLGAQDEARRGRAVVYREAVRQNGRGDDGRSDDGSGDNGGRSVGFGCDGTGAWEFLGEIRTEYPDFGYMWECPNLLQFETGDVLLFCPQGLEPEEHAFQNRYQSGYVAGALDLDGMVMKHGDFHELDRGFDFYAPQV